MGRNKITQDMLRRQAIDEYSVKYGVTKAAIRYKSNRQYIYRWKNRYDGTLTSLADKSHRPHHHPNQHTVEELTLIRNMRSRNPNTGLAVLWVKLRQRGYTRSISGLYRILSRNGQMAVKLPNPKYIPKPYEQMQYPRQRGQIDVKFVPASRLVGEANGQKFFQYIFIDKYSRFPYLEAFEEHSTYSSVQFLKHVVEQFPYAIECIQTHNGMEFTNRLSPSNSKKKTLFESILAQLGILHKLIPPYTPRHNGKVELHTERTMKISTLPTSSIRLRTSKSNLLFVNGNTTIYPCVLSTGTLPNTFYLLSQICNSSLTNLQFYCSLRLFPK